MSYVIVAGQEYEIDTPEQVAEARSAIAHNLPATEPNRVPVWAGAPGCPDSYRTSDFLTGEPRTLIVWGRGAAERWNADLMGLADPSDFAQVQDRAFPAGVTDRNGNLIDSDCWICTMVGSPDVESNLDEDDAVLGYCNAAAVAPAEKVA